MSVRSAAFIQTRSGILFRPLEPDGADVRIEDIAHALSNQCRWSGHTLVHYSVAEHSVRVSELAEAWRGSKREQLWALLHDASEAYLVDLPTPLKNDPTIGDAYRDAEKRLMRVICERFGLDPIEPWIVRDADAVLLATEARDLMQPHAHYWEKLTLPPLPEPIVPWSQETARNNFIARFRRLTA